MTSSLRRAASIGVLFVAGLASLATSQIPRAEDTLFGQTEVGADAVGMHVQVTIASVPEDPGESTLEFAVRADGNSAPSSIVEVQIVRDGAGVAESAWMVAPASIPMPVEGCDRPCSIGYTLRLRVADPAAGVVVVPWRMHAIVYGDVSGLTLSTDSPQSATELVGIAGTGFLAGLVLGALATLIVAFLTLRRRSRLAALEALGAFAFILSGVVVAQGFLVGLLSWVVGLLLVVGGVAVLVGLVLRRPFLSAPSFWLVPIALAAGPIILARFSVAGEFRIADVLFAFGAVGLVTAMALVMAAVRFAAALRQLQLVNLRTVLVAAMALAIFAAGLTWAWLIAAGNTPFVAVLAVPYGAIYLGVATAFWRWIGGDSLTPFVVGLLIPFLAGLAFAGMLASAMFLMFLDHPPAPPYLFESCALLALGGGLFAVSTVVPPSRRDKSATRGRALQGHWEDEVVPLAPASSSATSPSSSTSSSESSSSTSSSNGSSSANGSGGPGGSAGSG